MLKTILKSIYKTVSSFFWEVGLGDFHFWSFGIVLLNPPINMFATFIKDEKQHPKAEKQQQQHTFPKGKY